MHPADHPRAKLSGWGGTSPTVARLVEMRSEQLPELLTEVGPRGVIARGLGRSYGDPAQNGGGVVVRLPGEPALIELDQDRGTVRVGAGVSLDDLLKVSVPAGWFIPVTPGTRFVTVGGAIASDIHGKNHHVDGSFANHVLGLSLLVADGSVVELGPDDPDNALFWATVGGMGLTGIIVEATIRMLQITSSRCVVDTERATDLDAVLAMMDEGDHRYRYSVAWLDLLATGKHLGRSVLTRGDHATAEQLSGSARNSPLAFHPRALAVVPPVIPRPGVMNRLSIGAFNEFWFRKAPRRRVGELTSIAAFFHPLDAVARWNRLYGARGFIQYQFVVPFGEERALATIVERSAAIRAASFVTVLKRFGPGNRAPLSFPTSGWTLTIDLATSQPGLASLTEELDRIVLAAGGRHYLAKDALTSPEVIRQGYPRLDEWRAVRDKSDPTGVWQSDQSRRLGLC